eukprot:4924054-Karenia_brevis.AAC.1
MQAPVGREIPDTVAMKRCRVAWLEFSMFAKAVLRADGRGLLPAQAFSRAKNRLDRWKAGDKA